MLRFHCRAGNRSDLTSHVHLRFAKIVHVVDVLSLWKSQSRARKFPCVRKFWMGLVLKQSPPSDPRRSGGGQSPGSFRSKMSQCRHWNGNAMRLLLMPSRFRRRTLPPPTGLHYRRRDRAVPSNVVCRLAPAPLRPSGQLFVDHVELRYCGSTAAMIAGTIVNVMSASISLSVPDSRCWSFAIEHAAHRVAWAVP